MQSISKLYEWLCENFATQNDGDHFIEDQHLNSSRVQFTTLISQRIIWVGTNGFFEVKRTLRYFLTYFRKFSAENLKFLSLKC